MLTSAALPRGVARLVFLGILLGYQNVWIHPPRQLIDLPSFYWAASVVFTEHRSPYTAEALKAGTAAIGQHVFPYLYPPPSLLLFYPLTFFSYPTAAIVVTCANTVLAAGAIVFILRNLLQVDPSTPFAMVALVYALSFSQVGNTIAHGQVNLLVTLVLTAAWWLSREGRAPFATAVCLGLGIELKTYPVILLGYLAVTGQRKAVAYTLALVAGASVLGWGLIPRAAWVDYWHTILPTGGYGSRPWQMFEPAFPNNQSLNGFMSRLFVPNSWSDVLVEAPRVGAALTYVLALLAVGYTLAACWRAHERSDRAGRDVQWSAMLCVMYLVAPLSWDHHLVIILPACLVALRSLMSGAGSTWLRIVVAAALCAVAWVLPFQDDALKRGWMPLLISMKFYAVVILWSYLVSTLWRQYGPAPRRG